MNASIYLNFAGNCKDAFVTYTTRIGKEFSDIKKFNALH